MFVKLFHLTRTNRIKEFPSIEVKFFNHMLLSQQMSNVLLSNTH